MSGESDLVDELRALRVAGDGNTFFVQGSRNRIEVIYSAGSSSSLSLRVRYDDVGRDDHEAIGPKSGGGVYRSSARVTSIVAVRPLDITLRSETPADAAGKREGINVEYQTGDAKFDHVVYVDSPTTDPAVLGAVLGPEVRQGVLALFVLDFRSVTIDRHGLEGLVEAYLSAFPSSIAKPGRGAQAIAAFDLVISNLPRLSASGGAHPKVPAWAEAMPFALVIVGSLVVGIPLLMTVAWANQCTESGTDSDGQSATFLREECGAPVLISLPIALAAAAVASALARRLARPLLRGRSDSATRISGHTLAVFFAVLALTYVVATSVGFTFVHRG